MKNINWKASPQSMAVNNCIVRHLAGSHAYGMNTPTSDVDYRGIFISEPHFWTPFYNVGTVEIEGEEDTVYHEVAKFLEMVCSQNPNIIETLWIDESDIVLQRPEYQLLRQNRSNMLSSEVAKTYVGYAHAQLKRIKGHNKWLNIIESGKDQLKHIINSKLLSVEQLRNHFEPSLMDALNVPYLTPVDVNDVPYDWLDVIRVLLPYRHARFLCNVPPSMIEFSKMSSINVWDYTDYAPCTAVGPDAYTIKTAPGYRIFDGRGRIVPNYNLDQKIKNAPIDDVVSVNTMDMKNYTENWAAYQKWRANRNVARSALESAHGYDTKHASHLIRLLKSGNEILTTGEVRVKRDDAAELLGIRNGSMTLDELLAYSDVLHEKIETAYANTELPKRINITVPTKLLMECREMWTESNRVKGE